jgi:beta-mannosidase
MAINWCYNEPWKTAAGNNVIAYPATPRPCYEYIRSALRPTLFSAKVAHFDWNAGQTFEAELWLLNDAPTPADGKVTVTATVGEQSFELIEWSASAAANSNTRGVTVRFVLPDVAADRIVLKLDSTNGYSSTYEYCYKPSPRVRNAIRQLNV